MYTGQAVSCSSSVETPKKSFLNSCWMSKVLNQNTRSQHQTQRNFNIYFSYLNIMGPGTWLCQSVECLPSVHEAWGASPAPHKLSIVYVCNPSTCEVAGGSGVQGRPHLQSKFKTSLDYMRPVYETKAKLIYCHNLLV